MSFWAKTRAELDAIANRVFETPEFQQLFAVKLTPERQRLLDQHYPHFIKSRRDCWAAASARAPLDVKRAIWEHEKDELIFDPRLGAAHLTDEQMADAIPETDLLPGVRSALYAWMYLASTRPWLEALTISHINERKNNPVIVKGGSMSARLARKRIAELGGTMESIDANTRVHMVADEAHSDLFEPIFERYVVDETTSRAVTGAALDGLTIDRAYRSALATGIARIPESKAA